MILWILDVKGRQLREMRLPRSGVGPLEGETVYVDIVPADASPVRGTEEGGVGLLVPWDGSNVAQDVRDGVEVGEVRLCLCFGPVVKSVDGD